MAVILFPFSKQESSETTAQTPQPIQETRLPLPCTLGPRGNRPSWLHCWDEGPALRWGRGRPSPFSPGVRVAAGPQLTLKLPPTAWL